MLPTKKGGSNGTDQRNSMKEGCEVMNSYVSYAVFGVYKKARPPSETQVATKVLVQNTHYSKDFLFHIRDPKNVQRMPLLATFS